MGENTNDPFNLLSILSAEELEKEVAAKIDQFHGLLTREAAMKLIAKEKGLLKDVPRVFKIKDIPKAGRKITLTAKIIRIMPLMKYSTGKSSRTMILEDETGRTYLKLWADDLKLFSQLKLGDVIEVKNAYERNGELGLGYSGELKLTSAAPFVPLSAIQPSTYINVRAMVSTVLGEKTFTQDNRTKRFFVFNISQEGTERECVIWEGTGRGTRLKPGDEIILERAYVKQDRLYIYGNTRILSKSASNASGKIESMECEGETLNLVVDGKSTLLERQDALKLLGVKAAEDISLSTIVNLKKEAIINSTINIYGSTNK